MKVLCVVPALPSEVKIDTLQSIFAQTVQVEPTIILTERIKTKLPFPAKMSLLLNGMLEYVRLEEFDYLLRVDGDTVLPSNFVEAHINAGFDAVGCGFAQLIRVKPFMEFMGGMFHPDHDDGYIIEKFSYVGLKSSWRYLVEPTVNRAPGLHQGSSWYKAQGELKYRYGKEPLEFGLYLLRHYCPFTIFELAGYFSALLRGKPRFDVADRVLYRQLRKFREPKRFLKLAAFVVKIMRGTKIE